MSYNCESLFLTYNPQAWWEKPDILNTTNTNPADQEILNQLGITDFCSKQFVKENFTFHHKCYRFDSNQVRKYIHNSANHFRYFFIMKNLAWA